LLAVFIGCILWIHFDSLSDIDLVWNQLRTADMQVGILRVENGILTKERNEAVKENETLYKAIEANTLILDYTTGLIHAYKVHVKTLDEIMKANGVGYPEFYYEVKDE
jgi:hypothetical protein